MGDDQVDEAYLKGRTFESGFGTHYLVFDWRKAVVKPLLDTIELDYDRRVEKLNDMSLAVALRCFDLENGIPDGGGHLNEAGFLAEVPEDDEEEVVVLRIADVQRLREAIVAVIRVGVIEECKKGEGREIGTDKPISLFRSIFNGFVVDRRHGFVVRDQMGQELLNTVKDKAVIKGSPHLAHLLVDRGIEPLDVASIEVMIRNGKKVVATTVYTVKPVELNSWIAKIVDGIEVDAVDEEDFDDDDLEGDEP